MPRIAPLSRPASIPRTQRRGVQRRERLLRAARELIARLPLAEVTYAGVCARAGVPASSAHHFYPDLDAVFRALLEAHRADMDAALMRPLKARDTRSWQAIVECLVDRAARYHRAHPVGAKLAIGGETPPQIKRIDRDADRGRAGFALRVAEEVFVVPRFADKTRVAYVATELVDTVFTASMLETGRLTPAYVKLAKLAAIGFLSQYLGTSLPPRPTVRPRA
jgi:AcrR family transcriptional regulator